MQIYGYNAASIKAISQILEIEESELILKMIGAYIGEMSDEDLFKLYGVETEEEAHKLFEEIIDPMMSCTEDPAKRRFRVWYDERTNEWVVDAAFADDRYNHPFTGRYDFDEYKIFTSLIQKGMELGVKPTDILMIQ